MANDHLTENADVLNFLRQEKARGRKLYLASGSNERYVNEIASRLGLFDGVYGATDTVNLSGKAKAEK